MAAAPGHQVEPAVVERLVAVGAPGHDGDLDLGAAELRLDDAARLVARAEALASDAAGREQEDDEELERAAHRGSSRSTKKPMEAKGSRAPLGSAAWSRIVRSVAPTTSS